MVTRNADRIPQVAEHMYGGAGSISKNIIQPPEMMYGKNRMFMHGTLEKGSEIGWHVHTGDGEVYYILSGEGEVVNNNASTTLAVAMGFAVAVVIGIICMFLGYLGNTGFSIEIPYSIMDQPIGKIEFTTAYMYYAVTALVCVFFVAAVLRYSIGLKKAYNKIAK